MILAAAALLLMLTGALALAEEPFVGYFNSYPSEVDGMELMPATGVTGMDSISGGWRMAWFQREPLDFSPLEAQIAYAKEHGLQLAIISELNPLFCPDWLRTELGKAGEQALGPNGQASGEPTLHSPLFRAEQERIVDALAAWLAEHDPDGVVKYIHPGAEWWYPLITRYHPLEIAAFQRWLQTKYNTLDALNTAWEADFTSFEEVEAPKLGLVGQDKGLHLGQLMALDGGAAEASWSTGAASDPTAQPGPTTYSEIKEGHTYTLTCWTRTEGVTGDGAYLEYNWVRPTGGAPFASTNSEKVRGTSEWTRLTVTGTAPAGTGRAWVLLKLVGKGTAYFSSPLLVEEGQEDNLLPRPEGQEAPAGWSVQNWSVSPGLETGWAPDGGPEGAGVFRITALGQPANRPWANHNAAVADFTAYWYEAGADYIADLGALVKERIPDRKLVTYLTMSFGFPAEWDYTQSSTISPDLVAMKGEAFDAIGMQVCSADGDPYRATVCMDVARKYGKPLWAVDLIDFTSGVYLGERPLAQLTHSAIQHGTVGLNWCGWHLGAVADYSYYPTFSLEELTRLGTTSVAGIKLLEGAKPVAKVALIEPLTPLLPDEEEGPGNDFRSFMGWYKLLELRHEPVDVVTLTELTLKPESLRGYDWVLVPDCARLPQKALEALTAYSEEGGTVITGGRFALQDEAARPLPEEAKDSCKRLELQDYGKAYTGQPVRDRHWGNTPPLFLWPAPSREGEESRRKGLAALDQALSAKGFEAPFEILPGSAQLSCFLWQAPGRQLLYLVNRAEKPFEGGKLLRRGAKEGQVTVHPDCGEGQPASTSNSQEGLLIDLPAFDVACVVELAD